ncbi:MAG TPA: DNA adenine methylase [Archangium sp.]
MTAALKAPFPWFGGKSRVAHLVWNAFGDVANYVEPFAGSLAVLLGRPSAPRIETVNDLDCYLANFWRAVQYAPEEVARWADWPVSEIDLHARHRCDRTASEKRRPALSASNGVHKRDTRGISAQWNKRPVLGKGARGVQRTADFEQIPVLGGSRGAANRGVHATGLVKKLPLLSGGAGHGVGVHNRGIEYGPVYDWMNALAARLRRVRVCCGDWTRVLGRSSTELIGVTGIFFDPPYLADFRDPSLYGTESADVRVAAGGLPRDALPVVRLLQATTRTAPKSASGSMGGAA